MSEERKFPRWDKVWVYWTDDGKWDFTPVKHNLPDGAMACEYVQNNDPFKAIVKIEIIEEPLK